MAELTVVTSSAVARRNTYSTPSPSIPSSPHLDQIIGLQYALHTPFLEVLIDAASILNNTSSFPENVWNVSMLSDAEYSPIPCG